MEDIYYINPQDAFAQALDAGDLVDMPDSPFYAGNYMYMGTKRGTLAPDRHLFKNIETREYLDNVR